MSAIDALRTFARKAVFVFPALFLISAPGLFGGVINVGPASGTYSYIADAGNANSTASGFANDNDLQLFDINLASAATLTVRTFGVAGGVNGNGQTVNAGGFEPFLSLFDASGNLIVQGGDGVVGGSGCGSVPSYGGFGCLDAFLQIILGPGNYTLALTQSGYNGPNSPSGSLLSDGFFFVDTIPLPNYTMTDFCGGFCLSDQSTQQTGAWALDITIDAGADSPVPEPATFVLIAPFVSAILISTRNSRRRARIS